MATEEHAIRGTDRCKSHPTRPSVARCDRCGRSLCLGCAVPVRGQVLGPECLEAVIGPDPSLPEVPEREPARRAQVVTTVAFAVAVIATVLPWSRFGAGSEAFGAWSDTLAWSLVAAVAAVLGLVISLLGSFTRRAPSVRALLAALAGLSVAAACLLAVLRPRPFTSPWLGPWVGLGAGVAGTLAAIAVRSRSRRRVGVHV